MKIVLPDSVRQALACLEGNGFEAYCVGGCVRDSLLGNRPQDWDIATSALPEETKRCFSGFRIVDTGIRHGTVTVLWDGTPLEITTFRTDGAYTDSRHPDSVSFSGRLKDDLARRDFTVNALAYNEQDGLIDCFGGTDDLARRILRCVGTPLRRFQEDALRILRCVRFAAVLGFSVDPETTSAALGQRHLLNRISQERIRDELKKLVCGKQAAEVLRCFAPILFTAAPELAPMAACAQETPYHSYDVWNHTLHALAAAPADQTLRIALLLHDAGKPSCKTVDSAGAAHFYGHVGRSAEIAREFLIRLRFSNREVETICGLVRHHGDVHPMSEKQLKKLLGKWGEGWVTLLFSMMRADLAAQAAWLYPERSQAIEETERRFRDILARHSCLRLNDLAVDGNDLLALGYERNRSLGNALRALLELVLEEKLPNSREALLSQARELLGKKT